MVGIVVYRDLIRCLTPKMAQMKHIHCGLVFLIVRAADFKANPMARLKQVAGRHDLNSEFIDLARDQWLWIRMGVEGLPWFGPFRVYLPVRTLEPSSGQESHIALWAHVPQANKEIYVGASGGGIKIQPYWTDDLRILH